MSDSLLILGVRLAGAFHFVTLVLACFTPIPPDWEKNLAALCVLPWLGVRPTLTTPLLKLGYALLLAECATYAVAYGWLAVR